MDRLKQTTIIAWRERKLRQAYPLWEELKAYLQRPNVVLTTI
jgi:hypothetical protein